MKPKAITNLIVVSDIHCGCALGLCPPEGVALDDGGTYMPSKFQQKVWAYWRDFWDNWVPDATRGEPFTVVFNGDAIDGVHHNSTTQITHNLTTQRQIAYDVLAPIVELCGGRYYHIRGTEAHVGKSANEEEALAKALKAIPNETGQYARYDLWKQVGPALVHLLHHVGSTGSQAYEATAVHKELTESFIEAARWGREVPDVIVRSHRHRAIDITIPSAKGNAIAAVTPCWQGKTPFTWKIPGARLAEPQFGGINVRHAHGRTFVDSYVKTMERSKTE